MVTDRDGRVVLIREPVRVPKGPDLAARELRRQIITGELREDDTLPPATALARALGVSVPTLREAVRILEAESLLTVRRGVKGGITVRRPDVSVAARYTGTLLQAIGTTVDDVNIARRVIEPAAVRMLANEHTPQVIDRLRELTDAEADAVTDARFASMAAHFHGELVSLTGNQTLAVMNNMLREILEAHIGRPTRPRTPQAQAETNSRAVRSHVRLVELIDAADADAAVDHWTRHLIAVDELVASRHPRKSLLDLLS